MEILAICVSIVVLTGLAPILPMIMQALADSYNEGKKDKREIAKHDR